MKKKKIIISIIILFIILIISIIVLNILVGKNSKQTLEYINSDEMAEGTVSPNMIHIVIAKYEGELNPKAISKSTYYLINDIIPEYYVKCIDDTSTKQYFEKNKEDIVVDIGIESLNDFSDFIQEIRKLKGELEFESARFDKDEVKINSTNLTAKLYIKYKNNEEISLDVDISNRVSTTRTSIKYSK